MTNCTSSQEVIDAIREMGAVRIGIDGKDGTGKSTLAQEISAALGLHCISLDTFLEKGKDRYVEYIDYPKLKATLENHEGYVVEGVCLRQVLQRIQLVPEANIYIKRMRHDYWLNEDTLDINEPVESVVARELQDANMFSSSPIANLPLAEEVIRYHDEFRPHNHADVTYALSVR